MRSKKPLVIIAVIVLVAALIFLGGGRWAWTKLLEMHGAHRP